MFSGVQERLRELAKRAGIEEVPRPVMVAAATLALVAIVWAAWRWWPRADGLAGAAAAQASPVESSLSASGAQAVEDGAGSAPSDVPSAEASSTVFVHVAGHVRRPGVYELPSGSRVIDAVNAAGGTVGDAATEALNLARLLADGEQVLVPDRSEIEKGAVAAGSPAAGAGGVSAAALGAVVNLNTASVQDLDMLPGVGPSTAQKIIAEREANGPFKSVDDLGRVSGIGPKRLDQLRDLVSVK